jgi:DNA-binding winged helix-turn-helix (wHTH) protein/tetratricopeptide (TPR) repeat protein
VLQSAPLSTMNTAAPNGACLQSGFRFGDFEYDPARHELRKNGARIRLQRQPMAILLMLAESPGVLVRREELRRRLWGEETFVGFEQGLNSAVMRLREALCDSAESPRYIETVPGEGYRFLGEVEILVVTPPLAATISPPAAPVAVSRGWSGYKRWIWFGAGAAVVCIAAASLWWADFRRTPSSSSANNWVLVTRFDNRAGDNQLDNVLDFALQSDLSNSRVVHVAAPERIQDTLRLMRKPADAVIDEQTGREICLRDGGIRAVISGRIEKLAGNYVLTASLIEAQSGATLRSFSAGARNEREVLLAVNRLSNQLRENMGEALSEISKSNQQLEKVTTPSFRALQLFSAGYELLSRSVPTSGNDSAAGLFSQAIQIDPEFASAHVYLGWALLPSWPDSIGRNGASAIASFARAKELADKASERERLFILQSWYRLQLQEGDLNRAIHYGELLTNLYPDFYWGVANQANLLMNADRPDEAAAMYKRALRLRPNDFDLAESAWEGFSGGWQKFFRGNRPDLAQVFRDKAESIAAHSGNPVATEFWLPFIDASKKSELGDVVGAAAALDRAHPADQELAHRLTVAYLSLGKLHKTEGVIPTTDEARQLEMLAEFLRGGAKGLRSFARLHPAAGLLPGGLINLLYARVDGLGGEHSSIQKFVRELPVGRGQAFQAAILGEEAISRKQYSVAARELRKAIEFPNSPAQQMFLADSLAIALEHEGDTDGAVAVLQKVTDIYGDELWFAPFRPLVLGHLAALYRQKGNTVRATALEARVKKLLEAADPDYSLDAQLGLARADPEGARTRGLYFGDNALSSCLTGN